GVSAASADNHGKYSRGPGYVGEAGRKPCSPPNRLSPRIVVARRRRGGGLAGALVARRLGRRLAVGLLVPLLEHGGNIPIAPVVHAARAGPAAAVPPAAAPKDPQHE